MQQDRTETDRETYAMKGGPSCRDSSGTGGGADSAALAALFLSTPDAVIVCDRKGRIVLANDQLYDIFGYRDDELSGQPIEQLLPGRFRDQHVAQRNGYGSNPLIRPMGKCQQVLGLHRDGREIPLEIRLRMVEAEGGTLVIAAVRDLSELRMLDEVRKRSNHVLEMIATGRSTVEVLAVLVDGVEKWESGSHCSALLLDRAENRLHTVLAPRLPKAFCEAVDRAGIGQDTGPCGAAVYRNERVIASEIASHANWKAFRDLAQQYQLEACWVEPIRDSRGGVLGAVAIYFDQPREPTGSQIEFVLAAAHVAGIAIERDLRATELAEKEEQLRRAQKLDAVGTLAGGIAHEFNNLLQVILGYTDCALEGLQSDEPRRNDMEQVRAAAEQAKNLTRQILSFSRRQTFEKALVDVNSVVNQVGKLLRPLIDSRIQVSIDCDATAPCVVADAGQLQQVLVNLCLNARDAIAISGNIKIATEAVIVDEATSTRLENIATGTAVCIRVSDDGCGIAPQLLAKIFDPFFTTKEIGKGTGLGLSVVYGIIRDHRGSIEVQSERGHGTTFRIYLPASDADQEFCATNICTKVTAPAGGTELILVADDEPLVRDQVARTLSSAGYGVITANDGEEAIELFRKHADTLRLAVLDIVMPKLDGRSAAKLILTTHHEFPLILLTGYDAVSAACEQPQGLKLPVLLKPVESAVLLQSVRKSLDGVRAITDNSVDYSRP